MKYKQMAGVLLACWLGGALMASSAVTDEARLVVREHEAQIKALEIESGLAWWEANTTGKPEAFARKEAAQNRIDQAMGNTVRFERLKRLRALKSEIDDKDLKRCVELLYLQYLEKQVDPEILKKMVAISNRVEKNFNTFRAKVDGKEMTENEVRSVLKNSTDTGRRKQVWEASKDVGRLLEADLRELVKLRNAAAKSLGFSSFHAMQLYLNEQDGVELLKLFDDLDRLTRAPFLKAKGEMDAILAKKCQIGVDELRPWHYHDPFFQESPAIYPADLDAPFRKADILALCRDFYKGIGLPIDKVLARSDLYEKPGKSPHAFCTDIDRSGDVRVLANIAPNEYWASTMLHELGHAVYSSLNMSQDLPYPLRGEAHILTTEGIAMLFERFSRKSAFLERMGVHLADPVAFESAASRSLKLRLLIFSRWCQVMLRFEKAMYENPDQDLNALWWDLVERYQGLKRPEGRNAPDFASKIHIVSAPVYYHNYMMGELFASQVHHALCRELYPDKKIGEVIYCGDSRVGRFFQEKIFSHGRRLSWNDLTLSATGKRLNPEAFAADFEDTSTKP